LQHCRGIIISGGPASVYSNKRPYVDPAIFEMKVPILGICYGHQVMAEALGGKVRKGDHGEYGTADLSVTTENSIFAGLRKKQRVWMSHRDVVERVPRGFEVSASTESCPVAGMAEFKRRFYGLQFHPEVMHTTYGKEMLTNFVKNICGCAAGTINPESRVESILRNIRQKVGDERNVFFLVSGGVDSTVAFALCVLALGKDRVKGLYIDTGFMRKYDTNDIRQFIEAGMDNIHIVDASSDFFGALGRTRDPEYKRRRGDRGRAEAVEGDLDSRPRYNLSGHYRIRQHETCVEDQDASQPHRANP
jgi:GMP synthase (glutamine-hydrolysing)